MAIILNKTAEIKAQMNGEKNVKILNSSHDVAMINTVNQQMESVRREYQIKERESQAAAFNVVLT
jgi:hypothetical protein